ncbi:hypothetical protein VTI74DRAFT_11154 [Chaetomium olivicolor]
MLLSSGSFIWGCLVGSFNVLPLLSRRCSAIEFVNLLVTPGPSDSCNGPFRVLRLASCPFFIFQSQTTKVGDFVNVSLDTSLVTSDPDSCFPLITGFEIFPRVSRRVATLLGTRRAGTTGGAALPRGGDAVRATYLDAVTHWLWCCGLILN